MGRVEKLLRRLKSVPNDFTFDEIRALLEAYGYMLSNSGKTSGSRVRFIKGSIAIILHKPHPRKELLEYQIKQILEILEKEGLL